MLDYNDILNSYPKELRVYKRFILREYLQYKILEILFNGLHSDKLCFLGGTCLRIVHNNSRFSEDLDFDNFNLTNKDFKEISNEIQNSLNKDGFEIEIKNIFAGAFHCHIRFPTLLYKNFLSGHKEEKILIQLDTEPQHFDFLPEKKILNKFDIFTPIFSTPLDILLSQKIYAIINRKRNKGRDFFDLIFLFSKQIKPNYDYLKLKLNINSKIELKDKILHKCKELQMQKMAEDVKPFLFNPDDIKKVILFNEYIEGNYNEIF